ncbi:efflux RND transporter permease subunit [Pseudoalteromonas sp. ASV78]|uniref:efflux RND transporter permease subunit n=1 Tax=Pseudoalteromonas sp. ASV78 TaxID=3397851 RepID=UPI0039FCFC57
MNLAIRNPLFSLTLTLLLLVVGMVVLPRLDVALYPDADSPMARSTLFYEADIEDFIDNKGLKFEKAIRGLDGVEYVEAKYMNGKVYYHVYFRLRVDVSLAKRNLHALVLSFAAQLPEYLPEPVTDVINAGTENYVILKPHDMSVTQLSHRIEHELIPMIDNINGVARTSISEPVEESIIIQINPFKVLDLGFSVRQIAEKLETYRFNAQLGAFTQTEYGRVVVSSAHRPQSLSDIENIVIGKYYDSPIYLHEVASITKHIKRSQRVFMHEGEEVLALGMWPDVSANLYQVSKSFQQTVFKQMDGIAEVIILNDPREFIEKAVKNILYSVLSGIISAGVIVLFFYRRLTPFVQISLSMPLAIGIAFIFMYPLGIGINILSIGAIGLTIGMVVDSAILVIDAILKQAKITADVNQRVAIALKRIGPTLVASNVTSIAIYLPLLFSVPQVYGLLFDIAMVAIILLIVSMLVSLFFIPALYIKFTSPKALDTQKVQKEFTTMENGLMSSFIAKTFEKKWFSFLIIFSALSVSGGGIYLLFPKLEKEVIAQPKAEIIDIYIGFSVDGLAFSEKANYLSELNDTAKSLLGSDLKSIYWDIRKSEAYISIKLNSYKTFERNFKALTKHIKSNDDYTIMIDPWITSSLKISAKDHVNLLMSGREEARALATKVYQFSQEHPWVKGVKMTPNNLKNNNIDIKFRELFASSNVSVINLDLSYELLSELQYSVEPVEVFDIRQDNRAIKVKLVSGEIEKNLNELQYMPMLIENETFLADEIYTIESKQRWRDYFAYNGREFSQLKVELKPKYANRHHIDMMERSLSQFINDTDSHTSYLFIDEFKKRESSINSLVFSLLFSVALVVVVLIGHFGRWKPVLICLSAIMFSIFGAMLMLLLLQYPLSLNGMLGLMILSGLSVNNIIIMLEIFNHQSKFCHSFPSLVLHTLKQRLQALLVTNLTTIIGMLPIAIGFGPAKDIVKPLGITVCYGLIISTLLILITIPAFLRFLQPATSTVSSQMKDDSLVV